MSNFRRRLMGVQQHGGLPAGYQEVEYIESTGTQWIDLNLYATDVGSWELEGAFTKIPTATKFEGNGSFGNVDNRFDIGVYNNKFWIAIGVQNNTITADYNKHYFKLDKINEKAYLDSRILSFSPVNWLTQTKKMRLFGRTFYIGNDDDQYCASMKCYSNKMYDNNNNLIMNLIPCLDTHSVPCMYDTVSKQTFYNQGTGEFSYPIDEKYTPVEYLESTGTQYIDTRYYPNNLTDVECKFMYSQFTSNTASSVFGVRESDGSVNQFLMSVFNGALWIVNGLNNTSISGITPLVNTEYILRITPQKAYWNGTEILNMNKSIANCPNYSMFMFGRNAKNGLANNPMFGKVYYLKIYEEGRIIRDYIPVIDSSGRPCLYDKVEDKFYYNEGSREFLYE